LELAIGLTGARKKVNPLVLETRDTRSVTGVPDGVISVKVRTTACDSVSGWVQIPPLHPSLIGTKPGVFRDAGLFVYLEKVIYDNNTIRC
jgi:hypothetical protein